VRYLRVDLFVEPINIFQCFTIVDAKIFAHRPDARLGLFLTMCMPSMIARKYRVARSGCALRKARLVITSSWEKEYRIASDRPKS
jgi:hypothetical protein